MPRPSFWPQGFPRHWDSEAAPWMDVALLMKRKAFNEEFFCLHLIAPKAHCGTTCSRPCGGSPSSGGCHGTVLLCNSVHGLSRLNLQPAYLRELKLITAVSGHSLAISNGISSALDKETCWPRNLHLTSTSRAFFHPPNFPPRIPHGMSCRSGRGLIIWLPSIKPLYLGIRCA